MPRNLLEKTGGVVPTEEQLVRIEKDGRSNRSASTNHFPETAIEPTVATLPISDFKSHAVSEETSVRVAGKKRSRES